MRAGAAVAELVERRVVEVPGVAPADQREALRRVQQPVDAGVAELPGARRVAGRRASRRGTGSRARRRARPARSSGPGGARARRVARRTQRA